MKFKVGDRVRVREDLVADKPYGAYVFSKSMEKYKSKKLTIKIVNNDSYEFEETYYYWTDEMLEEVKENKMEKTILEIINEGYTGKKYVHESGTIVYVDHENILRFDYNESNRISSDRAIRRRSVALDMKLKEYRKQYPFEEAFKSFEKGKEIESVESNYKYRLEEGGFYYKPALQDRVIHCSIEDRIFSADEILANWYIND